MRILPYGSWPSPIDARLAAAHDGRPEHVGFVGDEVWWTAPRPAEAGRRTLVRRRQDGAEESVLPAPWNVRALEAELSLYAQVFGLRAPGIPTLELVR